MHSNIKKIKQNESERSEKFYAAFPAIPIGYLRYFKDLRNNKLLKCLSKSAFSYQWLKRKLDNKYRPQIFQLAKKISILEKQTNKLLNLKHNSKQSEIKKKLTRLKGEYQKRHNNLDKKFPPHEKAHNYIGSKFITLDQIVCKFVESLSSNGFFCSSRKQAQLFWKHKVFNSLTEAKGKLYNALIESRSKKGSRSEEPLKYKLSGYFCGIVEFEYIYYAGHLNLVINNCLIYNLEKDLSTFLKEYKNKYYQATRDIILGKWRLLHGVNAKFYDKFNQTNKIKPCKIYRHSNSVLRQCHAQLVLIIKLMQLINFSGKYACTDVLMHILSYRLEFSAELGDINTKKVKSKTTQKKVRTRDEIRFMVNELSTTEFREEINKFFQSKNRSALVIKWEYLSVSPYFASKFERSNLIRKIIRPLVSPCKIL